MMENLLVENEIFCDLDSIKLDLDSDLFDLSPFEFEHAAATATGAETEGVTTDGDPFANVGKGTPKMEATTTLDNSHNISDEAKEALSSLSSLLSPPSTPVINSNNVQQPSWNLESLLKSRQQQQQQESQLSSHNNTSSLNGMFTPFDAQPPPPNKNIINHQDKNVIQQILDGLQQQQQPVTTTTASASSSVAGSADLLHHHHHQQQRRPIVVVSAIQDDTQKNSLPKFKLEMIKEAAASSSLMTPTNNSNATAASSQQQQQPPTASRTLVPEANHPIMLQKPLIAKDQKTGNLQLLPESLVHMDGKILSLGDLLSASGLHKNLICNLDIKPSTTSTTTPSGSLTPPINSASSVNFGQYPHQPQQPPFSKTQAPSLSLSSSSSKSPAGIVQNNNTNTNDHSTHGLVHKLLASPINQLMQPWQMQPQRASFDSATPSKSAPASGADAAAALFPTNHSALAQQQRKNLDSKAKIFAEATSLENVFPDSFSNKVSSSSLSSPVVSTAKNGIATPINWGGDVSAASANISSNNNKASPENSLRSVIKNNIIKSKQQKSAAAAAVTVKQEVDAGGLGCIGTTTTSACLDGTQLIPAEEDLKTRAAAVGVFMEGERCGAGNNSLPAVTPQVGRGAISMPSSPVSFLGEERESSFFDAFVKTDLDEIIPEPLDNDCIICGVAFQTQAALRDHLEEHRDHISMIQSGGGQSASLIDSPPYSSNSSVVGSEEINNGTSSGCPSMADAAEFYVNASMPASPASSTSSLDQLFATTGSPVRGGGNGGGNNNNNGVVLNGVGSNKRIDTGSTLASLLVSNISPLLSSMDASAQQQQQQMKSGPAPSRQHSYPGHRSNQNQAFGGQNLLAGSTVGGIINNGTSSGNAIQRNGFVASLFQQQQQNAGLSVGAAKWKKTSLTTGVGMSALLGGVGGGNNLAASVNDQPQFYGKIMNGDQKKMVKTVDGTAAKIGQKRKMGSGMGPGMGISKSCPVSPAMKDMMMGAMGGSMDGQMGGIGANGGGMAGSDMMAGHQGPKTKKCRRVYGLNQKNLWCTQCQWKKACARFKPPKQ